MGAEFIFCVISTVSSLLSSIRSSGCTRRAEGEGDGIERDLNRLERLLKRIQAALRDAGEKEIIDEYVKLWLAELKALAYEAEDILDEWQYELLRCQTEESGEASSSSADNIKRKHFKGVIPNGMAQKIKHVIERFEEISRDKEALSFRDGDGERLGYVSTGLWPTSHMVNESSIFGRDEDKKKILDFVLSDNNPTNPLSIIAIVGMGGIGKTTLAQLVYNDSLVQTYFHIKAWAYVSPEFDVIKITKQILESINPQESYECFTGLSATQNALAKAIREKKLLIVLDDVWNELPSKWEQFLEPLRSAKLARIIMTARNKAVAQISRTTDTHDLSCLSADQSGLLFEHYVFSDQFTDETSCLRNIGVQILRKCAGLPLAIKSIGRVLSYRMSEDSWRAILESELWESEGKDEIFPALKVSYYSLPAELKPCFLFCSLFPKGSELEINEIIYMWIAHGYIQSCGSKRPEDLGNLFIHELYRRSFLTKVHIVKAKGLEYFRMHDLIHDLARSISVGEFYTNGENINDIHTGVYHTYIENPQMIDWSCHRCLLMRTFLTNFVEDEYWWDCFEEGHIFDLTYTGDILDLLDFEDPDYNHSVKLEDLYYEQQFLKDLPSTNISIDEEDNMLNDVDNFLSMDLVGSFGSKIPTNINLRVLKWERVSTNNLVNIANLKHLRYLELNNRFHPFFDHAELVRLPESISLLFNLVALKLNFLEDLKTLPSSIGKLFNLRLFCIHNLGIRDLPESLGQLTNLQHLSVSSCKHLEKLPTSIGNLTSLRQLYISCLNIRELPESFCMLKNLHTLSVDECRDMIQLPNGIGDLVNLRRICCPESCIKTLPESISCRYNPEILQSSGCRDLPFDLHEEFKNLSLQPLHDLVKMKINGYQGNGYASLSDSCPSVTIEMNSLIKSDNLFTELGELKSLKSLSLVGITSIQKLEFSTLRFNVLHTNKVLFPSLIDLEFVDLHEWNVTVGERDGDFPILESLKIDNCPKLSEIPNFHHLRRLEIIRCSFSKLELDLLGLQLLESLHIEECFELTLLQGLQSLNSIRTLFILWCPLLKDFMYSIMPKLPLSLEIVVCPSLKEQCQIQKLHYIKDFSCKSSVSTPDIWNIMKNQYQSLTLDGRFLSLTSLEIRNCWKLETLEGLSILKLLRRLVLWDCPQLQLNKPGDESRICLPPCLQSLAVHGCHGMLSLDLLALDPSSLTELEVTDCKRLMHMGGLHGLTKLETLAIIQCPHLLLELLPTVPDCVVISKCPRLKAWCEMHSIEPLDDETE